jgi:succinyl-CoA synthetase beta subunit
MKLHEYQSKQLFSQYGIPVPKGKVAASSQKARSITIELGGRSVIKSQVLVGGRGKAGGVRAAKSPEEASLLATEIIGMTIKGLIVRKILVEEAVSISQEIYIAIVNDRNSQKPILIASGAGGVEIEEIAQKSPEKITKRTIDPILGLKEYQLRDVASIIDLDKNYWNRFSKIIQALWKLYLETDATLVEINPLVITSDQRLLALDAKVVLDDNGLFRHPDLCSLRDLNAEESAEIEGRKIGVVFIKLEGTIGCLVNGAGLAMATMDIIKQFGGEPANFLDIGGGANAEKVAASLRLILSDKNVKAILVNVFGGITRCDEVAKGLMKAFAEVKPKIPVVVRLVGTNDEEGVRILQGSNLIPAETLSDAARIAVDNALGVAV